VHNVLYARLGQSSPAAAVIISIALMLLLGFVMTRLTKLVKLPNVTAYILTGIVIGPYCLDLIPKTVIDGMDFLADIALAFIAFSVGEFFRFSTLKKNGMKVAVITALEAFAASVLVFLLTFYALHLSLAFSIVLGALAAATAPASTIMTIRQTGAHGNFVETLLQVIALDNVVSLVAFSIAISVALSSIAGVNRSGWQTVALPVLRNVGVLLLGGLFGVFLKWLMPRKRTADNRLIISVSLLFAFCGICALMDVSPLLGCMSMSTVYINITGDEKLFRQLNYFSPPILLLFFVRSGLSFRLDTLFGGAGNTGAVSLLTVGVLYFFARILGKYAGAFFGCLLVKTSGAVRRYLGLALIPQAGVAIGLAALCARTLGEGIGTDLETIILASSVLYEMIGPGCAKLALYLSKSYSNKLEDITTVPESAGEQKTPTEALIERIRQVQSELPARAAEETADEDAFTEAAEEQYQEELYAARSVRRGRFLNSR